MGEKRLDDGQGAAGGRGGESRASCWTATYSTGIRTYRGWSLPLLGRAHSSSQAMVGAGAGAWRLLAKLRLRWGTAAAMLQDESAVTARPKRFQAQTK